MDEVLLVISLIVMIFICLILTIIFLLRYIGIFISPKIVTGKPNFGSLSVAYKFHESDYNVCSKYFAEISTICPHTSIIGIFYDDPKKGDAHKSRYIIGAILDEDLKKNNENIMSILKDNEFNFITFPSISYAITSSFPFIATSSAALGASKVYPALREYINVNKLSAHPFVEIYTANEIQYMVPLSMQADFYPPEAKDILGERHL